MSTEPLDKKYGDGVHIAHCCKFHGCKYGEPSKCAVYQRQARQEYPCEDCPDADAVAEAIERAKRAVEQWSYLHNAALLNTKLNLASASASFVSEKDL